ncbi:MAG: hypothetical protein KAH05_06090 [Clostridiales bacterium]|nr:hypothetical protein [Clostridiales bacterium]
MKNSRNKLVVALLLLITFTSLHGCTTSVSDIDKAKETVTQFMNFTYTISDYTSLDLSVPDGLYTLMEEYEQLAESYATQIFIDRNLSHRFPWGIRKSAAKNEFNLKVSNILLDQIEQDEDEIYMDYEITLDLSYQDGSQEEVLKSGKLQLLKVNDKWKINHEKSNSYPIILKDNSVVNKVITEYKNDSFEIKFVQTKELPPLTPDDENFDIYKSAYYGQFELWLIKDDVTVDILNLNNHFGMRSIGFIGKFDFVDDDINGDGNPDFNIGIMKDDIFEFVVFTVDYKSIKVFLFDGSYILKSAITNHSERFTRGTEGELIITLPKDIGGFYERKYLWNETWVQFESDSK